MKCLVTGVAGFVGSHIAERLLKEGYKVTGIDCFTDYYPRALKEANIEKILEGDNFTFIENDLLDLDLEKCIKGSDYILHQAAQAGVRKSWGRDFGIYVQNNIICTQRLLEASKKIKLKKFVYASSSSVYGDAEAYPTNEETAPMPISPYGVSKLAAEHLCYLYWKNFNIPTISLRYFTVYGPGQRPDMAFNIFTRAVLKGNPCPVYGSGNQTRDFTFIQDVVEANLLAMLSESAGDIFNIGGGSQVSINQVIKMIEQITGLEANVSYQEAQKGDVTHTSADITKARKILGYSPKNGIYEGLTEEVEWMKNII
ncbi:MAG: GDP-mannose 4,6-dehydratase [Candidatus Methanoperedens sp.]|nr:GDP-mannose 4,6-dehydratase [Candidatus Methanoperedens sp.]